MKDQEQTRTSFDKQIQMEQSTNEQYPLESAKQHKPKKINNLLIKGGIALFLFLITSMLFIADPFFLNIQFAISHIFARILPAFVFSIIFVASIYRMSKKNINDQRFIKSLGFNLILLILLFFGLIYYINRFEILSGEGPEGFFILLFFVVVGLPLIILFFSIIPAFLFNRLRGSIKISKVFNVIFPVLFWLSITAFLVLTSSYIARAYDCNFDFDSKCVADKAIEVNDSSLCESKISYTQDFCYGQFSKVHNNISMCNKTGKFVSSCFAKIAIDTNNPLLCKKTKLFYHEDDCYIIVSANLENLDVNICNDIRNNIQACVANIAISKDDVSLCDSITTDSKRYCIKIFENKRKYTPPIYKSYIEELVADKISLGELITDEINLITNPPFIKILSPNGGESFNDGDVMKIEWDASQNIEEFKISFVVDGWNAQYSIAGTSKHAGGLPIVQNTGFYNWTIDMYNSGGNRDRVKMRIVGSNKQGSFAIEDESDDFFSVVKNTELDNKEVESETTDLTPTSQINGNIFVNNPYGMEFTLPNGYFIGSNHFGVTDPTMADAFLFRKESNNYDGIPVLSVRGDLKLSSKQTLQQLAQSIYDMNSASNYVTTDIKSSSYNGINAFEFGLQTAYTGIKGYQRLDSSGGKVVFMYKNDKVFRFLQTGADSGLTNILNSLKFK